jgi:hypothetical protein
MKYGAKVHEKFELAIINQYSINCSRNFRDEKFFEIPCFGSVRTKNSLEFLLSEVMKRKFSLKVHVLLGTAISGFGIFFFASKKENRLSSVFLSGGKRLCFILFGIAIL